MIVAQRGTTRAISISLLVIAGIIAIGVIALGHYRTRTSISVSMMSSAHRRL